MIINICHNNQNYSINTEESIDISIPFQFNGSQPNYFDVKEGQLKQLQSGGTIFSVSDGGGCNVSEVSLNIHCSGTHTECVGHLHKNPGDIGLVLKDIMFPAILTTVAPSSFDSGKESYHCDVPNTEQVISKKSIQNAVKKWEQYHPQALVIRTMPNPEQKKSYHYNQHIPPFFTNDALRFITSFGIQHLVVDLPSIDRMEDNGILGNHRIFWGDGENATGDVNTESLNTITELAFISDAISDGFYFLNLQIPHFVCDAAPSRPILIKPV